MKRYLRGFNPLSLLKTSAEDFLPGGEDMDIDSICKRYPNDDYIRNSSVFARDCRMSMRGAEAACSRVFRPTFYAPLSGSS